MRWNSTFYMLKSLVAQKQAIAAYAAGHHLPATLNAHQWTLVENMLTILDPGEQLTRNISKATAADVIPSIQALTCLLKQTLPTDQGVKTSKDTLLNAVQSRFGHIEEQHLYYLATILDPRYKDRYFTLVSKRQATGMLREKLLEETDGATAGTPQPEEPPEKRSREDGNNSLLGMFEAILEENTEAAIHQEDSRVDAEVSV